MRNLLRLSAVMLGLGMLGAAACSSCNPPPDDKKAAAATQPASYTCGAGTHRVGNQCVGNSNSTSGQGAAPAPISTTGNN